jgi:hypothetical protein
LVVSELVVPKNDDNNVKELNKTFNAGGCNIASHIKVLVMQ